MPNRRWDTGLALRVSGVQNAICIADDPFAPFRMVVLVAVMEADPQSRIAGMLVDALHAINGVASLWLDVRLPLVDSVGFGGASFSDLD